MTDHHADGWGMAFFEGSEQDRGLRHFIDHQPASTSPVAELIRNYPIKSRNIIAHIRKATQGVVITGVLQNGPAATAGVRPGDVVMKVAGQKVLSVPDLLSAVASLKPGKAYTFEIDRQNKPLSLSITPAVRPI